MVLSVAPACTVDGWFKQHDGTGIQGRWGFIYIALATNLCRLGGLCMTFLSVGVQHITLWAVSCSDNIQYTAIVCLLHLPPVANPG